MRRRDFLSAASAFSLALALGAQTVPPSPPRSRKKGLGMSTKKATAAVERLHALKPAWFYNWGSNRPEALSADISYTPMIWGYWGNDAGIEKNGEKAKAAGQRELLGFNEPDGKDQANLSVEKALAAWPALMKTGLRLGSPACVHPDNDWMKAFMKGAEERKLRVDFICMHSYGGTDADGLVNRIQAVSKAYGHRPVWLTEFAVADWQAKTREQNRHKPDQVLAFMKKVMPKLEALECLERHAWFPSNPDSAALGPSALHDAEGKLTPLGEYFRSL
jgi:hypothetical protein